VVALVVAIVLTPRILRHLREAGFVRENYRGVAVPFPAGIAIVAVVVVALVPLAVVDLIDRVAFSHEVLPAETGLVLTYSLGVALLGLIDDLLAGDSRGWRGHGRAVLGGAFSTGALKAVGSLGLALYAVEWIGYIDYGRYALAAALLALTTNLFNLLDLRPGRAVKAFVLLGAGLAIGGGSVTFGGNENEIWGFSGPELFGLVTAPVLVLGFYDLRERAMLGDTGANLVGGLAGLWMVLALGTTGQAIALAVVLALTVYGEFRSLSALIERTPLLRQIDSIGRNDAHA
jgi:UDP-GlcNAc:undecaprenyl-phosphate GlcNAc-1-phosphate transferase